MVHGNKALNFPYPAVDPLGFLVDDEIRPFIIDIRHDLTGTGAQAAPIQSTGVFIVHEHVVPEDVAEIVMGVFPHCWARTNVGAVVAPLESVHLLDFNAIAGFVLFDNSKNNNQPFLVSNDYNKATVATFPNDRDRDVKGGTTFIDNDAPVLENIGMRNPYTTTYLPAGSTFRVLFQLAPMAPVNGVPNPYQIGTGTNRIDFAGALVFGLRMPQQKYNQLLIARRMGGLGQDVQAPVGDIR
jgi:hypothetical protein